MGAGLQGVSTSRGGAVRVLPPLCGLKVHTLGATLRLQAQSKGCEDATQLGRHAPRKWAGMHQPSGQVCSAGERNQHKHAAQGSGAGTSMQRRGAEPAQACSAGKRNQHRHAAQGSGTSTGMQRREKQNSTCGENAPRKRNRTPTQPARPFTPSVANQPTNRDGPRPGRRLLPSGCQPLCFVESFATASTAAVLAAAFPAFPGDCLSCLSWQLPFLPFLAAGFPAFPDSWLSCLSWRLPFLPFLAAGFPGGASCLRTGPTRCHWQPHPRTGFGRVSDVEVSSGRGVCG
eukprot:33449-Chlamydomonas_euryale.AAC.3